MKRVGAGFLATIFAVSLLSPLVSAGPVPVLIPPSAAAAIPHTYDGPQAVVGQAPTPQPAPSPLAGPPYAPGTWEYMPVSPDYPKNVPIPAEMTKKYPSRQMTSLTPNSYTYNLGDHKAIVVLAEFSDTKHQPGNTQAHYDAMFNGNGSADRTVRTYFYQSSAGNYTLTSTVSAWVTLPQNESYYATPANSVYLVGDAAAAADSQIDFSQFDESGDGWVDNFIISHAGRDHVATGDATEIWSHMGVGYAVRVDGKSVSPYATAAEDITYGSHIGSICHEFGHLGLDLPDLYDTAYNNAGLGDWEIMASGAWGGGGYVPNLHSAWSKYRLGWIDPVIPDVNIDPYTIYPMVNNAQRNPVKIETNYTNEYFLLEFRYKSPTALYDTYVKGRGRSRHMQVKPGDKVPIRDLDVTIVTANGEHITRPLCHPCVPNPSCSTFQPKDPDPGENARSVGSRIAFGRFRMVDLGDLTWNKEQELVCPNNLIGTVDVYLTTHHGTDTSGPATIVHALKPRVAIMNNGATKGGTAPAWQVVHNSPGIQDIWQLHYSVSGGKLNNTGEQFIANLESDHQGKWIKLSAESNGDFTVTNGRNNFLKTYKR